jgi:hypothetical protein
MVKPDRMRFSERDNRRTENFDPKNREFEPDIVNEATKPAMQRSGSTMNNGKDETAAQAAQAARDRP